MRRRLSGSRYEFKYSNEHEPQQLCSVNRPILLEKCFTSKAICFVKTTDAIEYCFNVVFLFYSCIVLPVGRSERAKKLIPRYMVQNLLL